MGQECKLPLPDASGTKDSNYAEARAVTSWGHCGIGQSNHNQCTTETLCPPRGGGTMMNTARAGQ